MILIDLNSFGFASTASGKTMSGPIHTGGVFGFLDRLRYVRARYTGEMVALHDGRSWRYDIFPEYKSGRLINPELVKLKEKWKAQKPYVVRCLHHLGIRQMFASNMEADDLAAKVSRKMETTPMMFCTGDGDWLQLLKNRDDCVVDLVGNRITTLANFSDRAKFATPAQYIEAKALSGDAGDSIPGVGGVGPVGAKWIFDNFITVERMLSVPVCSKIPNIPKKVNDFRCNPDKNEDFRRNLRLVDLNHPDVPAAKDLKVVQKPFNKEALIDIFGELAFVSIIRDFDNWVKPFERRL